MRDHIRLLINGHEHSIPGRDAFTTLATYLRNHLAATGTKIVCEEGDCGACTVLVRRGTAPFVPVNSCIIAVCQLDGASIVTVEGLTREGQLHPVQESMIANHGAQCGYCTPGFVVAMSALFENGDDVDERAVRDGLTGNLCRCTGYEPIIKAALSVTRNSGQSLADIYPGVVDASDAVRIETDEQLFFAPTTIAEAVRFKTEHAPVTILQGGTDVGVWINKRSYAPAKLMSLAKLPGLNEISVSNHGGTEELLVGANVTLSEFERATRERIPELYRILNIFGSPQIKNAGTLVGNIANGSPIGDTLPYLFVSGARLEIAGPDSTRFVPVQDFYLGYKTFDLGPGEIITKVAVPCVRSDEAEVLKLYKVSRRKDLDISAFTAAIRLRLVDHRIATARIAFGGVAPVVLRMKATEEFLRGKPLEIQTFEDASEVARGEVKPISDVRGSREYRLQLAENILQKFYFETFHTAPPPPRASSRPEARS